MINVVLPCLANGIFPQVMNQVRANPCCADALTNGTAVLGISPDLFVLKVLNYTTDVVCATQTPGYDGTTNQTCGYAWFKSFTATDPVGNSSQIVERLISSVQVPNDQGCAAVKGDPFVATTGAFIAQLFGKPFVPDACVNPVDNLLRYVRLIPGLVSVSWEGFRPLDALEKGKCAREASMPGICVHLANGEYGSCPFASSWKSAVFPATSSSFTPGSGPSTTTAASRSACWGRIQSSRSTSILSSASEDDNDDESFRVLSTDEEIAAFVESDLPFVTDKSANLRQGGLLSLIGFSKWMRFRPPFEPILVSLFVPIMERHADKEPQVRDAAVRTVKTVRTAG
ncbi:hypothetical protein DYB32_005487 [Aphanomyces invadans]|uniref:Uncharacterized protein n=1 Tax=Aphanomyces invadans TaxID=157072 RepID=A0A3R6VKW1_9STRA|nr:hypothetical protein DYB32_005487 [Aphanomyces invadans]